MASKRKYMGVLFILVLFISVNIFGEVDHIRWGSKNTPLEGLTVTWRGNYSHCTIRWGYTTGYEAGTFDIQGRIEFGDHNFYLYDYTFPTLKPGETLHYSFQEHSGPYDECKCCKLPWTKDKTFKTSGDTASEEFTFIAGGDSRGDGVAQEGWGKVAEAMQKTSADFYLYLGDLALQGGDKRMWETWFDEGKPFLSQKLNYHSVGNHEGYGDPRWFNFKDQLVFPDNSNYQGLYYSFEFGNAAFIVLNTQFPQLGTERAKALDKQQTKWLEKQLKKYRGKKTKNYKEWVVIAFHRPFFTIDKHAGEMTGKDPDSDYATTWWKNLFDKYGVDVIINGHTHAYMRSEPILLVGTGPGGSDITFDKKGLPAEPVEKVPYGNKKGQGRLEIVTGGYGVPVLPDSKLPYRDQWYVAAYKSEFHYCVFSINGKELNLQVRRAGDDILLDRVSILH